MKPLMFKVIVTEGALKDIDNLTQDIRRRIASKIKDYATSPLTYARKLTDPKIGSYRFRVGLW